MSKSNIFLGWRELLPRPLFPKDNIRESQDCHICAFNKVKGLFRKQTAMEVLVCWSDFKVVGLSPAVPLSKNEMADFFAPIKLVLLLASQRCNSVLTKLSFVANFFCLIAGTCIKDTRQRIERQEIKPNTPKGFEPIASTAMLQLLPTARQKWIGFGPLRWNQRTWLLHKIGP